MFDNNEKFNDLEKIVSIKVIGVGGGGNNAVATMINSGVQGVEFYVANTDAQTISASPSKNKIIIGKNLTRGLGAGSNPETGKNAAMESEEEIKEVLVGANMIFVAAGMGGGTGTGAAPIVAKIAKEQGALVVGIVTTPFEFEGPQRKLQAVQGLDNLKEHVDSLIIISNEKLKEINGNIPLTDSFKLADNELKQAVQMITDLISVPTIVNLDFADVKSVMENKGRALFGVGIASGEDKAYNSAMSAIESPLLEASIRGAKHAIVNVTGGNKFSLDDAHKAVEVVRQSAGADVNIIFGVAVNEELDDEMIVSVIATEFDESLVGTPIPKLKMNYNKKDEYENKEVEMKIEENNTDFDDTEEIQGMPSFLRRRSG